ncbi:FAD/NAD(P)-binding protein [Streptomyces sp. SCSIO ZS0520]|uniref:FAD/NAD(P)-binding protein n=1 Tax=Streptomyces sp. SCSIO ZS0520 TaxID=2892996 RepID=UPI0021D87FFD|nr:FAD/NAD(P)-binding protein [Streptomyces sp. SCSIO ZS0520]
MRPRLVIVGAGPRGTGVLERIAANAPALYAGDGLDIHLVDPYPPGGGRIWREAQSPLLWMNSMAEDVTMFTDETVETEGPVRPGPALDTWSGLPGQTFPGRQIQGGYLRWVYEHTLAALPGDFTVRHHRARAVRLSEGPGGVQQIHLEGRAEPLEAEAVVLTLGHLDAEPDAEQRELTAYAERHRLLHLPPDFTADSDLSALAPGEPVLVRGFGLAFVDLMVLLTEGRGGSYEEEPGAPGGLRYVPSGREPVLHVGSRRGVPYHSKIGYPWTGANPPLPRFLGPEQVEELRARPGGFDFRREVWPLIAKELGFAHYHRLFTAHPERTGLDWAAFEKRYAALAPEDFPTPADPGRPPGRELRDLLDRAGVDPADRLDLAARDRPLRGVRHDSFDGLQSALRGYVAADLDRSHDPAHSPDLAVFLGLLSVYGQLARLGDTGTDWHGFFSYLASGPPGPRLRQLLALSRAGIVRFLGAGLTVAREDGVFRARSSSVPGAHLDARALVEARLPEPHLGRTRDLLLRALYAEDAVASPEGLLAVDPADGRLRRTGGGTHPRRFALGPHTDARSSGAFTRPRTNSPAFRQNDAAARALLCLLREPAARAAA